MQHRIRLHIRGVSMDDVYFTPLDDHIDFIVPSLSCEINHAYEIDVLRRHSDSLTEEIERLRRKPWWRRIFA